MSDTISLNEMLAILSGLKTNPDGRSVPSSDSLNRLFLVANNNPQCARDVANLINAIKLSGDALSPDQRYSLFMTVFNTHCPKPVSVGKQGGAPPSKPKGERGGAPPSKPGKQGGAPPSKPKGEQGGAPPSKPGKQGGAPPSKPAAEGRPKTAKPPTNAKPAGKPVREASMGVREERVPQAPVPQPDNQALDGLRNDWGTFGFGEFKQEPVDAKKVTPERPVKACGRPRDEPVERPVKACGKPHDEKIERPVKSCGPRAETPVHKNPVKACGKPRDETPVNKQPINVKVTPQGDFTKITVQKSGLPDHFFKVNLALFLNFCANLGKTNEPYSTSANGCTLTIQVDGELIHCTWRTIGQVREHLYTLEEWAFVASAVESH